MSIRFASWNIEGRLSPFAEFGRGTPEAIVREIEKLDADVVTLPEAFVVEPAVSDQTNRQLRDLGYSWIDTTYDDNAPKRLDSRIDSSALEGGIRMMSRLTIRSAGIIRPADFRNLLKMVVDDPETKRPVTAFAIHLDDRSEATRQAQLKDLIAEDADVINGDYNATDRNTLRARMVRSLPVELISKYVPSSAIRSLSQRAIGMVDSFVLPNLASATDMKDADPDHRPTATFKLRGLDFLPAMPVLDLDHIYVGRDAEVSDFKVMDYDGGADHRAISATVSW